MKIYHNPRCRKSREALQLIENEGKQPSVVEYLKTPPSKGELQAIVTMLGIHPLDLIRKNEDEFKEHFKGKELSDDEWIDAMVAYPKLIERPIVVNEGKAVVGRPPEKVLAIL